MAAFSEDFLGTFIFFSCSFSRGLLVRSRVFEPLMILVSWVRMSSAFGRLLSSGLICLIWMNLRKDSTFSKDRASPLFSLKGFLEGYWVLFLIYRFDSAFSMISSSTSASVAT